MLYSCVTIDIVRHTSVNRQVHTILLWMRPLVRYLNEIILKYKKTHSRNELKNILYQSAKYGPLCLRLNVLMSFLRELIQMGKSGQISEELSVRFVDGFELFQFCTG